MLAFSPETHDFGAVTLGHRLVETLTLTNTGRRSAHRLRLVLQGPPAFRLTRGVSDDTATDSSPGGQLRAAMRPVSGSWGSGYLLDTPLLCVLITSDGRVLSGSVEPAELYAAAG